MVVSSTLMALEFADMFEFAVFSPDCSVVIADALLAIRGSASDCHAEPSQ